MRPPRACLGWRGGESWAVGTRHPGLRAGLPHTWAERPGVGCPSGAAVARETTSGNLRPRAVVWIRGDCDLERCSEGAGVQSVWSSVARGTSSVTVAPTTWAHFILDALVCFASQTGSVRPWSGAPGEKPTACATGGPELGARLPCVGSEGAPSVVQRGRGRRRPDAVTRRGPRSGCVLPRGTGALQAELGSGPAESGEPVRGPAGGGRWCRLLHSGLRGRSGCGWARAWVCSWGTRPRLGCGWGGQWGVGVSAAEPRRLPPSGSSGSRPHGGSAWVGTAQLPAGSKDSVVRGAGLKHPPLSGVGARAAAERGRGSPAEAAHERAVPEPRAPGVRLGLLRLHPAGPEPPWGGGGQDQWEGSLVQGVC